MSLAVYLHWPYCLSKCPYCDFNSHVRAGVSYDRWLQALPEAITAQRQWLDAQAYGRPLVSSIFFGGGTPSLMPPELVARLIANVEREFILAPDAEITLEANPNSVEVEKFKGFRDAGVNRISIGVQSFDDAALSFLGRGHSQAEARQAIDLAQKIFSRVSFDLIYGLPNQAVADWEAQLQAALAIGTDHLSLYQLTIEQGTAFATAHGRGDIVLPPSDYAADLYEATEAITTAAGLPAYEVSNYARPGQESRHNLIYWNYGDYLGIGPGAHGRVTLHNRQTGESQKFATRQEKLPEAWLNSDLHDTGGHCEVTAIAPPEKLTELMMMGLRLTRGINRQRFQSEIGRDVTEVFAPARLAALVTEGDLVIEPDRFNLTLQGRLRLNLILEYLLGAS
ncbi:MAG: radical SAM family heme chaperone HemW [Alphaproteobacteria bacterium]|nr:radical SAM family heme chaperone HemW [Alphaproteobacteria bacterium]